MNKIALIIPAYQSNLKELYQALSYGYIFDEVILHVNDKVTMANLQVPGWVKVIYREERIPVQDALNEAIASTTSEWILPFSDDDYFDLEKIIMVVDLIRNGNFPGDVLHYPIFVGNEKDGWNLWGNKGVLNSWEIREENSIPYSSVYKKEVWIDVGGYKQGEYSDWAFWCQAYYHNCKFFYMDSPVYFHRQNMKETLANKEAKTFNKAEFLRRIYG